MEIAAPGTVADLNAKEAIEEWPLGAGHWYNTAQHGNQFCCRMQDGNNLQLFGQSVIRKQRSFEGGEVWHYAWVPGAVVSTDYRRVSVPGKRRRCEEGSMMDSVER